MRLVERIPMEPWENVPAPLREVIERRRAEQAAFEAAHGKGRQIVSTEFKDWRFVAVGNTLHYSKKDKTRFFTDFLNRYLREHLGFQWGEAELAKPPEQRHVAITWWEALRDYMKAQKPRSDGATVYLPTGAVYSWFGLAYDLYLIKHNAKLQRRILDRLRRPDQFQGARFELAVTAAMVVAGFSIDYEDEADGSSTHPEFVASHPFGVTVAVEAKSRHRDGVLGFKSVAAKVSDKVAVEEILRKALGKDTKKPYFVFVDVNLPPLTDRPSEPHPWWIEMHETEQNLQREWDEGTFPANAIFFCNDGSHYTLNDVLRAHPSWCYEVQAKTPRFPLSDPDITMAIAKAMLQRANVPQHFPAE